MNPSKMLQRKLFQVAKQGKLRTNFSHQCSCARKITETADADDRQITSKNKNVTFDPRFLRNNLQRGHPLRN